MVQKLETATGNSQGPSTIGRAGVPRVWVEGQAGAGGQPAPGCPGGKVCADGGGCGQAGPAGCSPGGLGTVARLRARRAIAFAVCHCTS